MLRREISGRGVVEAVVSVLFVFAILGVIFDRQGRGTDAIAAGLIFVVLFVSRLSPDRSAAWREKRLRRRAGRAPKVYTARKRRAAGVVVVLIAYAMVRPDRNGNLAAAIAYSMVFCGLIALVLNVRKQHFVNAFRRLTRQHHE